MLYFGRGVRDSIIRDHDWHIHPARMGNRETNGGGNMRVAVAADGKTEDSLVSSQAGRAPYYLVFEEGRLVECIKNPFAIG